MKQEELDNIEIGDVVRNLKTGVGYVIVDSHRKIAVRTIQINNAQEWEKVK